MSLIRALKNQRFSFTDGKDFPTDIVVEYAGYARAHALAHAVDVFPRVVQRTTTAPALKAELIAGLYELGFREDIAEWCTAVVLTIEGFNVAAPPPPIPPTTYQLVLNFLSRELSTSWNGYLNVKGLGYLRPDAPVLADIATPRRRAKAAIDFLWGKETSTRQENALIYFIQCLKGGYYAGDGRRGKAEHVIQLLEQAWNSR